MTVTIKKIFILLSLSFTLVIYQNCDEFGSNSISSQSTSQQNVEANINNPVNVNDQVSFEQDLAASPQQVKSSVCNVFLGTEFRFFKEIEKERCSTYCERVRPEETSCNTHYGEQQVRQMTGEMLSQMEEDMMSHEEREVFDPEKEEVKPADEVIAAPVPDINLDNSSLPSEYNWSLMYEHKTLGITQDWLDKNRDRKISGEYTIRRGSLVKNAPGGGVAFLHTVKKDQLVYPFRFEGAAIKRNNSLDNAYLLRFKHYVTAHSGAAGKIIQLEGGRGYAGDGYRFSNTNIRGTGGWGANSMHPKIDDKNYYRLLCSYNKQKSPFGDTFTGKQTPWPLNRWITVDIVAKVQGKSNDINKGGYRLYVDGELYLAKDNINIWLNDKKPVDAKTVNYYIRLMHGGHPDEHLPVRDYKEYFKDLQLYRGTLK